MTVPIACALPIIQAAWVVDDLDAAMAGWIALGVGPFFTFEVDMPEALYRGAPEPLRFRGALAQAGDMQIELIQQTSDGPSAYRDVVPKGQSGFHHICRAYGAYDETIAQLRAQGVAPATEARPGGARVCYADTRAQLGCMLEVLDANPAAEALSGLVRRGADGWDGRDPVREVDFTVLLSVNARR